MKKSLQKVVTSGNLGVVGVQNWTVFYGVEGKSDGENVAVIVIKYYSVGDGKHIYNNEEEYLNPKMSEEHINDLEPFKVFFTDFIVSMAIVTTFFDFDISDYNFEPKYLQVELLLHPVLLSKFYCI